MELKLVPKMQQSLVMTPQLKMAIKLLTLNHLELKDAVAAEIVENPVLEEMHNDMTERAESPHETTQTAAQTAEANPESRTPEVALDSNAPQSLERESQIDWDAYAESYDYLPPSAGGEKPSGDELPTIEQTLSTKESLQEHLLWQVRMSEMNSLEQSIARRLIGEINDDGMLDSSPMQRPDSLVVDSVEVNDKVLPNDEMDDLTDDDEDFMLSDGKSHSYDFLQDGPASHSNIPKTGKTHLTLTPKANPIPPATQPTAAHNVKSTKFAKKQNINDDLDDDHDFSEQHGKHEKISKHEKHEAHLADQTPVNACQLVADDLSVPIDWVESVRKKLMYLDPVGCFAKNTAETLLSQLEVWGYDDECLVYNIVKKNLHDVEHRNFQAIMRTYKVPMADVIEALKLLEQLDPKPARNFLPPASSDQAQYITPDATIEKVGDEYVILLNEDGLPKLNISKFYLNKIRESGRGNDPSKSYIKDKMRLATWLIRSIHQRQRTIYKVLESILRHQKEWFDYSGPLKPLILKTVASDIGMHESTVSRVTTRKYVHTHRGIFELKYFFNSSINTGDGSSIASESVKNEIKRIVSGENPKKPLSDAVIVKMLAERNIDIARRTVAKYREMLGILPSSKRKQVF